MKLRLRELRTLAFLSQEELAQRAGVSESTVKLIERGVVSPHLRTVRKLAEALGVHPRELLADQGKAKAAA
jgi:transcriptional regulator with XRE-family HTH domain